MEAIVESASVARVEAPSPSLPSTRAPAGMRRLYPLLLLLAGLGAYANSFRGVFVLDDDKSLRDNPLMQQPLPSWQVVLALPRGVWQATLALNHALGGQAVAGYHAVNLAIHLLAGLVLFGLVRRTLLLPSLGDRWKPVAAELALAVALLWLVHPLQTESVTYITQRAESLMGLFYLLTLYALLRGATASRHRGLWYALAILCCALGMRTKEVMVTAPLLAVLYDRIFLASSWREVGRRRGLAHLGLAATLLLLAGAVLGAFAPPPAAAAPPPPQTGKAAAPAPTPPPANGAQHGQRAVPRDLPGAAGFNLRRVAPLDYLRSQPAVLVHYLRLALFPYPLCLDYGWPPASSWAEVVPAGLLILALLLATVVCLFRWPALGFLGAWFFLILAPTSSILPIADLAAEHRMYLPLAAVIALVVLGGYAVLERLARTDEARSRMRPVAAGVVIVLAVACIGLTWRRNADYSSALRMWQDVVAKSPDNPRGHYNLSVLLWQAHRPKEALASANRALELDPQWPKAHTMVGVILLARKHNKKTVDKAIRHFQADLAINPDAAPALAGLGFALLEQDRTEEAIDALSQAVSLDPDNARVRYVLGTALLNQGKARAALLHLEAADHLEPGKARIQNKLGKALVLLGERDRGLARLRSSVALASAWVPYRLDLAAALVEAGQKMEAAAEYDRAAAIQAEADQFTEAVASARRALELARAARAADLVQAIEARLHRYEQAARAGAKKRK